MPMRLSNQTLKVFNTQLSVSVGTIIFSLAIFL